MNKHRNQLYLATDQLLLTLFKTSSRVKLRYKTPSLIRPFLLAFWKVLFGRFYCIYSLNISVFDYPVVDTVPGVSFK